MRKGKIKRYVCHGCGFFTCFAIRKNKPVGCWHKFDVKANWKKDKK